MDLVNSHTHAASGLDITTNRRELLEHIPAPAMLSPTECLVIEFSRRDSLYSISGLPGWRPWFAKMFASALPNRLANEKLEELRRFAILSRVYGDAGGNALGRIRSVGYTVEQAALVAGMSQDRQQGRPRWRSERLIWAISLFVTGTTFTLVDKFSGVLVTSLAVAGLVFAILTSLWTSSANPRAPEIGL